ncbi:uncharacterized protein LOC141711538 [Apium graveolens]|uniref:uncharacterized protein LOC141711538 n=1 Tax=Apium graveolens TaxID=4045 RepID=UPI003D7B53C3
MTLKSYFLFLILLALSQSVISDQWFPVNPNDQSIQKIAKFAVDSYNKGLKDKTQYLNYSKVVNGKYKDSLIDHGKTYLFNLVAKNQSTGASGEYLTFIFDDIDFNLLQLLSFEKEP